MVMYCNIEYFSNYITEGELLTLVMSLVAMLRDRHYAVLTEVETLTKMLDM